MKGMSGPGVSNIAALVLSLAACSPDPAAAPDAVPMPGTEANMATVVETSRPAPPATAPAASPVASNVLTLEGLGDLRIGEAVPASGSWRERGAQVPGPCRTIASPEFPGVYAIVEDGKVRRITIGDSSRVKLIEDIGSGASEADVRAAFPGFREEPHKYVERPAKYLTAPNAAGGDAALRFEIGRDGKVSLMHVGTMPVLGYVEGCA